MRFQGCNNHEHSVSVPGLYEGRFCESCHKSVGNTWKQRQQPQHRQGFQKMDKSTSILVSSFESQYLELNDINTLATELLDIKHMFEKAVLCL